ARSRRRMRAGLRRSSRNRRDPRSCERDSIESPAMAKALIAAASLFVLAVAPVATETAADLSTPTGIIHGTLLMPEGSAKVPVALIIAGSGPTDRDGNSPLLPGKNNSYKMLAEALAAEGIASLRYDKRSIAASRAAGLKEADLRFDNYVDDAA